jgi:hypothetical protein
MKILLVFSLIIAGTLLCTVKAQTEEEKLKVRQKMWSATDTDFKLTVIDPKYANESAVILCRSFEYEVKKEVMLTYLYENTYMHERIKLLDKAAVDAYSELEFNFATSYQLSGWSTRPNVLFFVGVKIIKPDGSEIEVKSNEAVVEKISQGSVSYSINKIAIPNLEPGDILDYYYVQKNTAIARYYYEAFEPWLYSLVDEYPIIKTKMELRIMRKCFLNIISLNGAPRFAKDNSNKENYLRFSLIIENIEKGKYTRWFFPYREYPAIKFQAFYFHEKGMRNNPVLSKFIDDIAIVREKFTKQEITDLLAIISKKWSYQAYDSYKVKAFLEKEMASVEDPERILEETVNYTRQLLNREDFTDRDLYGEITNDNKELLGEPDYNYNLRTIALLSLVLKSKSIAHEVFITTSNRLGTIDEFLIPSDLILGIVLTGKQTHYISSCNRFSTFGELPVQLQGNKAYSINIYETKKKRVLREITLPGPAVDQSSQITNCTIRFEPENMDSIYVQREISVSGYLRYYYQNNLIIPSEYIADCRDEKYGFKKPDEELTSKKKKQAVNDRIEEKQKQDLVDRMERCRKLIKSEYDIENVNIKDFKLVATGMWSEEPVFKYQDRFVMNDYISKTGQNYLLEVGQLVGSQVKLDDEELAGRTENIYLEVPRSYTQVLEIEIPEGFTPMGIDELNMNIGNSTGSFVSTAEFSNRIMKITTQKKYNHSFEPADNWSLMVEFLKAAYDFTQKKILLQKNL